MVGGGKGAAQVRGRPVAESQNEAETLTCARTSG